MSTFLSDLRIGFRILRKEKSFAALAITALALGICGVTAMFSVVNGLMLRGFTFPNADRLVSVQFIDPKTATAFGVNAQVYTDDYQELRQSQQSYDLLAAFLNGSTVNMTFNGQAKRYTGAYVTEDFLKILGVAPAQGRDFTADDNRPGAEKAVLIGYAMWQRDFGAAPNILGTAIRVNGKPATIVGVMPKGFAFPTNEELWIPLFNEFPPKPRTYPTANNPQVVGLIKRQVSLDQANAEATAFARRFAAAYPDTNKNFNAGQVQPLLETYLGKQLKATMWTMFAFCVGVLLIACVNVMNMQFARATLRAKELAIRSSLGAARARLIRQMLTESLLLSAIGAVVGVALAYGAVSWLMATVRNLDNPIPSWISFDIDPRALLVTVLATVLAALGSGFIPAWMSSRASAVNALRDGSRGTTNRSVAVISRGLVVATAGFFDVTGQKLLDGRGFTDEDLDSRQPVAIVNAAFAQKHFGRESAVGRQFRTALPDGRSPGPWRTIVGVVTTTRMMGPFNNPGVDETGYYVPYYAAPVGPVAPGPAATQFATVAVRPRPGQSLESAAATLRQIIAKADPNLPLYFVGTPKFHIESFVAQNRVIASMFTIFGLVAIVLASVGIYGVMSFSVSQRTQEFGVRMALGADTARILRLVMRQGSVQVGVGLAAGIGLTLAIAIALGPAIQATLFGVTGTDPVNYIAVGTLVAAVSLIATFIPARRATRVDPNVALRDA